MVKIKRDQNASEESDQDPTDAFSRRFRMRENVASSERSICDPTDQT